MSNHNTFKSENDLIGKAMKCVKGTAKGDIITFISVDGNNGILSKRFVDREKTTLNKTYTFSAIISALSSKEWEIISLNRAPINAALDKFKIDESTIAFVTQPIFLKFKNNETHRISRGSILHYVVRENNAIIARENSVTIYNSMKHWILNLRQEHDVKRQEIDPMSLLPFKTEENSDTLLVKYATNFQELYSLETGNLLK